MVTLLRCIRLVGLPRWRLCCCFCCVLYWVHNRLTSTVSFRNCGWSLGNSEAETSRIEGKVKATHVYMSTTKNEFNTDRACFAFVSFASSGTSLPRTLWTRWCSPSPIWEDATNTSRFVLRNAMHDDDQQFFASGSVRAICPPVRVSRSSIKPHG